MDAVTNATNALMSLGHQEPLSGGQMLDEVTERRYERQQEPAPPPVQDPPAPQRNEELDFLKTKFAEFERNQLETRSLLDRQSGAFQQFLQQNQNQGQQRQVDLPTFETDDPQIAAALNTLERRFDMKLQQYDQYNRQTAFQQTRQSEAQRFEQAINELPELTKYFTRDQLHQWGANHINNGVVNANWKEELTRQLNSVKAPQLEQELNELRKKQSAAEKRQETERQQQKQNLKLVPGIGQRSGGQSQSRSLGEQILNDFKGKGRSSKPSYKQFGAELLKRISAQ